MEENKKHKIKKLLAEYLGIETNDINEQDYLKDDLHMGPVDLTDFALVLTNNGMDVPTSEWNNIETLEDLYDYIG